MLYILPTKRGFGVELWGTYDDLKSLYDVISKFWNYEENLTSNGFETRDKIISGFSYELRKCYDGYRLTREESHFYFRSAEYFGCEISWVHFLFSLNSIRYNTKYYSTNKYDLSLLLQLEYWLENAMFEYDGKGAKELSKFISDLIYLGNDHLYLFMRRINAEYFSLGGGKIAFRKLSRLMRISVLYSNEYNFYLNNLTEDAKKLNCKISDLELNDENIDYENLKW